MSSTQTSGSASYPPFAPFSRLYDSWSVLSSIRLLGLRLKPTQRTSRDKETEKSQKVMREIGEQLLNDSRAAVLAEHSGKVEKDSWQARDLLSLLLKANMATDLQPKQRMSDEDVLARTLPRSTAADRS